MAYEGALSDLGSRLYLLNFILKGLALCFNTAALILWTRAMGEEEVEQNPIVLPAYNEHELMLFYHTIPACQVILSGLVLLYVFDEIPRRLTQRTFVVALFTLQLITGTIGIQNCITADDFSAEMLVMSILCICVAAVLVTDFVKLENFFKSRSGLAENVTPVDSRAYVNVPW